MDLRRGKHVPVQAACWPAGKLLGRRGPGVPAGYQADHKVGMHFYGKSDQQHPGLHYEEYCQQVEEGHPLCLALMRPHLEY